MSNASIRMLQSATGPATPPSGYTTLWAKTDDNFYITKDTGVTVPLAGSAGTSGVNGTSGSSGSSGNSGTSGSSGSSGQSGTSGSSGSSGQSGTSGSSGSSGQSGTSGSSGSSGQSGTSGSSGSSGQSGTSGSSGSSGESGTSGSSGSSGESGTSGVSGTSGSSGSSGNSGTSGVDGLGLRGKNIQVDASDFVYDSGNGWSDAVITFASSFGSANYSVDFQWVEDSTDPNYYWWDLTASGFVNVSIPSKTASSVTIRLATDVPTVYPNLLGYVQCLALLETGVDGTSGSSGSSGVSGTSGSSGSSGQSGTSGSSGSSGESGTSGSSGSSGQSGTSGSSGSSGINGLSSNAFNYKAEDSVFTGDPGPGYLLWDSIGQTGANNIHIDSVDNDGRNLNVVLGLITAGQKLILQDKNNSANFQTWSITGAPTNVSNNYWTIPVTLLSSGGTGNTDFPNDLDLLVFFIAAQGTSGTAGSSGSSGQSGTSGSSGSSGESGTSGSSGSSGISGSPSPIIEIATDTLVSNAIGATACGRNCAIVFGNNAKVNSDYSVVIGANACTNIASVGYSNIVIGADACSIVNDGSITIGHGSYQCGNGGVIVGVCSWSTVAGNGIMVGNGIRHTGNNGPVSFGADIQNCQLGGVTLGQTLRTCNTGIYGVNIGNENTIFGSYNTLVGACSCTNDSCNAVVIGYCNRPSITTGFGNIILGTANEIYAPTVTCACNNIIIGCNSSVCNNNGASSNHSIIIGFNAKEASGDSTGGSIVIGYNACAGRSQAIVIGYGARTSDGDGSQSVSIGYGSLTQSALAIAIGHSVCANGYSVAMGYLTQTNGGGSVALGMQTTATCVSAIGLGYLTSASNCGSVALGICAVACHDFSYVLSACKTSERANTVHVNHLLADGQGVSKIHTIGATGGASAVVNWDNGNNQTVTLTANTTFAFNNPICGGNYALIIEQGGSGSYCVTWPGTVKWAGATGPTLSTGIGDIDMTNFIYDGTNYYGYTQCNFG